jgi:hypothetical protein
LAPAPDENPETAPELPVAIHVKDAPGAVEEMEKVTLFPVHTLCEGGVTETTGTG